MKKYYYIDESPMYPDKFLIKMNSDLFLFPTGTAGSYAVFISRVLGLSYPDYLRFARDVLGAEIIGKNHKYPIAFFDRSNELTQFVKMLNARMEMIMFDHNHPYELKETDEGIQKIPHSKN